MPFSRGFLDLEALSENAAISSRLDASGHDHVPGREPSGTVVRNPRHVLGVGVAVAYFGRPVGR
jgi:hypothetical protein